MQGGFEEFLLVQSHCFLSSYFSQGPGCTLCWAVPEMGQPRGPRVLAALQIEMPEVLSNFPLWLPGHCSFQQLMPDVRLELESYHLDPPDPHSDRRTNSQLCQHLHCEALPGSCLQSAFCPHGAACDPSPKPGDHLPLKWLLPSCRSLPGREESVTL